MPEVPAGFETMNKPFLVVGFSFLVFLLTIGIIPASPQTSLFSIPTTDVAEKGRGYIEADFDAHFGGRESDKFRSYGFLAVYGVHKDLEVGLNGYFVRIDQDNQPVELQPNVKWQAYQNEKLGLVVAAGAIAYFPLSKRAGTDAAATFYSVASKQFKGDFGPRLTGGGYGIAGRAHEGDRYGALIGVEQPVHRRITFIADWNTGNNRFGYAAAGFGFTITKKSSLYAAYYFGNEGRGNNSLGIYYGYAF